MRPALEDWQQLNACRRGLVSSFLRHYRAAGYREAAPLSVTSKQDESVVFVGAAISALKKDYIYPGKLPAGGLVIAQDAVRTRNVKNMLADDFEPKWGSYFTNIDTVFPYELKDEAFAQALAFFSDKVKLAPEELLLRVHSEDEELYQLVRESGWPAVEVDAHPEKYYRH